MIYLTNKMIRRSIFLPIVHVFFTEVTFSFFIYRIVNLYFYGKIFLASYHPFYEKQYRIKIVSLQTTQFDEVKLRNTLLEI